jgi:hypothetical protein
MASRCPAPFHPAQAAPDHLHVANWAEDRTRDNDHIGFNRRRVLFGLSSVSRAADSRDHFKSALRDPVLILFKSGIRWAAPQQLELNGPKPAR